MDLIWRNEVPQSKVVMGLAFYSRTFTLSDRKCHTKGCEFDSAGDLGGWSGEIGLPSNAEIARLMASPRPRFMLDKEAAVRVVVYRDQWITYDDEDTFKLKVDFARTQCMGGVMVWAVNHDTKNGTFSKSLRTVVRSEKPSNNTSQANKDNGDTGAGTGSGPTAGVDTDISETIPRDQCRWSNCGEECPSDWQHVHRRDPYKMSIRDRMWDDTGCQDGSRRSCCPPGPEP